MTALYAPGTEETDPKKQNRALQLYAGAIATNTTNITALQSASVVSATKFGVVGDGASANDTAIAAAIAYCVANNVTLGFPDGVYNHASTIEWAYPRLRVIAFGANVVFAHTGTGIAHSFNGLTHGDPAQGVFECVFGGAHRIALKGNSGTTKLAYVNNWHHGEMKIRGRDAQYIFYGDNAGGTGQAAAVSSTFDVQISQNADGVAFSVVPDIGLYLNSFFNCIFVKPLVEGCGHASNMAVQMVGSSNNTFWGGSAESNLAGGMSMDSASVHNIFLGTDFESNGGSYDLHVTGSYNTFLNVQTSATTSGQLIDGSRNVFQSCILQSATVSGAKNLLENCGFLVAFTDSGFLNTIINPDTLATAVTHLDASLTLASATAVPAGGTTGLGLGFSSTTNLGVFFGSGVPTLSAAQGSLYLRTDGSSTSTRLYVNTNGTTGWTNVVTAT